MASTQQLVFPVLNYTCLLYTSHSITCVTTKFEELSNIVNISVDIIVDRDSIKKIIIGKGGERLKLVGSEARKELEVMLDKKVYL